MRRSHDLTVCIFAAFVAGLSGCSNDDSPSGPQTQPPTLPATMSVVTCEYQAVSSDTLEVVMPSMPICDSATDSLVWIPDTTTRAYYTLAEPHLKVSLSQLAPLMLLMTSGPSFSSDIASTLHMLDSIENAYDFPILAVLSRIEGSSGLVGLWSFTGLGPDVIDAIISSMPDTSSLAQAVQSMVADEAGRPVVLFRFDDQRLTGLLSRAAYGKGAIANIVDTAVSDIVVARHDDSTWTLTGNRSGEVVTLGVDDVGGITYRHSDAVTYPVYTYKLWPEECPQPVAPPWFGGFLTRNPR